MFKKLSSLIIALMLVVAVFTGCSGGNKLEKYVNDNKDQINEALAPMAESLGDNASIDLTAQGDEVIFTFKFGEELPAGVDVALKDALGTLAPTFESMADSLKAETGVDKVIITIKYLDKDGKELATKSFESK